jgi:hypothetical protein
MIIYFDATNQLLQTFKILEKYEYDHSGGYNNIHYRTANEMMNNWAFSHF